MGHLVTLPRELLDDILHLLPGRDIKSTRAACHHLNYAASPLLFQELYLSCHPLDLEVFQLVANNPLLIENVKELIIDDTTMAPSLMDWPAFRTMAEREETHWPDRRKPYLTNKPEWDDEGREWSSSPDKALHDLYVSICEPHHKNRLAYADLTAMRDAVPKMKSLRRLVLSNRNVDDWQHEGAQSKLSSSPTVKLWRQFSTERRERAPFPPRCDWWEAWGGSQERRIPENMWAIDWFDDELGRQVEEGNIHFEDTKNNGNKTGNTSQQPEDARAGDNADAYRKINGESHEGDNEEEAEEEDEFDYLESRSLRSMARIARGLAMTLEVLSYPHIRTQLTEFRIDPSYDVISENNYYHPGLPMRLFATNGCFIEPFVEAFSAMPNLKKCVLALSNSDTHWDGQWFTEQGHVSRVLAATAHSLEELILEAHGMWTIEAIQDITFPKLRKLELMCGDMMPKQFIIFLERHGATIQDVNLAFLSIDPENQEARDLGSWQDVVEGIGKLRQEDKIPKLTDISFFNVFPVKPHNGCGMSENINVDLEDEPSYSWIYGLDEEPVGIHDDDE